MKAWPAFRETLPAIFDGVETLPGEPTEDLIGPDGMRLV